MEDVKIKKPATQFEPVVVSPSIGLNVKIPAQDGPLADHQRQRQRQRQGRRFLFQIRVSTNGLEIFWQVTADPAHDKVKGAGKGKGKAAAKSKGGGKGARKAKKKST